jgi:hypothetical protein
MFVKQLQGSGEHASEYVRGWLRVVRRACLVFSFFFFWLVLCIDFVKDLIAK